MDRGTWTRYLLVVLAAEKAVQHFFVTAAFYNDWGGIRGQVVVDYRYLLWSGLAVAFLFVAAIFALGRKARWGVWLMAALGLFDIVGEFVAQGTFLIAIPLSFLMAVLILVAAYLHVRTWRTAGPGTG